VFQQEEPSKASVILRLKAGIERLPRERVEGIARLLEGSISNLKAENVNIIADGRSYRMPKEDSEFAAGTRLMEQKVNTENHLARKIEKAIGIGEAIVTIDIDKVQIAELREEGPDSDKTMIETTKVSKKETTDKTSGGVPGARPGSGKQGTAVTGTGTTNSEEEFETVVLPYIKLMRQLPTPGLMGKIGNVSATVRVALTDIPFQSGIVNFDFGDNAHVAELDAWKKKTKTVVKNICQTTEDQVAINVVPTKRIVKPEIILTTWEKIAGWWAQHWSKAMLGLLAMIAVIFVAHSVTKTAPREVRTEEVATVAMLEGTDLDEEEEEEEEEEPDRPRAKPRSDDPEVTLDEPEVSVRDQRLTLMRAKVQEAVAEDPRKVAALLRSWIRQEL
jgi:flagellar biosynthesis/type III secretory pathway M-ring protein FliF/YscJ